MLLTITYTGTGTTDLGFLLFKNPYRPQKFELGFGDAYVFYPEISDKKTTAALLLDINPINLARGKEGSSEGGLFEYINDRPYVCSSFMSVAVAGVFRTAMTGVHSAGMAEEHKKLCDSAIDLEAVLTMLPCRSDDAMLKKVFEPLGYEVKYEKFLSDENFPDWGESKYVNLTLKAKIRLCDLLKHIYILIPVFDRQKHYWIGNDEVEKLLRNAGDWLSNHNEKEFITSRYLKRMNPLVNLAFSRLNSETDSDESIKETNEDAFLPESAEIIEKREKKLNLNMRRLGGVVAALKNCRARSVIDIGCGEGNLLRMLSREKQFERISGADVSCLMLERASEKLKLIDSPDNKFYLRAGEKNRTYHDRINLFQSSLTYKDARFKGYDAACVIEVIEHLDPSRLSALERVLFDFTKPRFIILTTPNKEYNVKYENIGNNKLRHSDHRFEWTRAEFKDWAEKNASQFGYSVKISGSGDADEELGAPTQMGVFTLCQ